MCSKRWKSSQMDFGMWMAVLFLLMLNRLVSTDVKNWKLFPIKSFTRNHSWIIIRTIVVNQYQYWCPTDHSGLWIGCEFRVTTCFSNRFIKSTFIFISMSNQLRINTTIPLHHLRMKNALIFILLPFLHNLQLFFVQMNFSLNLDLDKSVILNEKQPKFSLYHTQNRLN